MREEQTLAEIEDFIEGFNQPTYRGMRVGASGWLRGRASTAGAATAGPRPIGSSRQTAPAIQMAIKNRD
jgi:hypothetical protein